MGVLLPFLGSSLFTIVAVGAIGWLSRNWLLTRLRASVQHEFNSKIEQLRSDLRKREDELRDIRSAALTALATHQNAIDTRRIEGIEGIWAAMLKLKESTGVAITLQGLNLEEVGNRIASEQKLQTAMQLMFKHADPQLLSDPLVSRAEIARPWVAPMIWALFEAYRAAAGYAIGIASLLKIGYDPRRFMLVEKIEELLKAALPDVDAVVPFSPPLIAPSLQLLELRLYLAIREDVATLVTDTTRLQQAQQIMKAASQLQSAVESQPTPVATHD